MLLGRGARFGGRERGTQLGEIVLEGVLSQRGLGVGSLVPAPVRRGAFGRSVIMENL